MEERLFCQYDDLLFSMNHDKEQEQQRHHPDDAEEEAFAATGQPSIVFETRDILQELKILSLSLSNDANYCKTSHFMKFNVHVLRRGTTFPFFSPPHTHAHTLLSMVICIGPIPEL